LELPGDGQAYAILAAVTFSSDAFASGTLRVNVNCGKQALKTL
jgi:hypothetical protein